MHGRLAPQIKSLLSQVPKDFGGGCSARKAIVLAWLICQSHARNSLDIGVYRGRCLFPQALAHRHLRRGGKAYGVDPWSSTEALEHDHTVLRDQIASFAQNTDFEVIYCDVVSGIDRLGLADYTCIMRTTSHSAAQSFAASQINFGLIHIDGNHDTEPVLADVLDYLPLLEPGGFLVMDDVSWPSVHPALKLALQQSDLLLHRVTRCRTDDYAVLRKHGGPKPICLRLRLRCVAGGWSDF